MGRIHNSLMDIVKVAGLLLVKMDNMVIQEGIGFGFAKIDMDIKYVLGNYVNCSNNCVM
jgi:hypothetical protein